MRNYLEMKWQEVITRKITKEKTLDIICGIIGVFIIFWGCLLTHEMIIFVGGILIGVALYRWSKCSCLQKQMDIRYSSLYDDITFYGDYLKVMQDVSDSLQYDCEYKDHNIYLTKEWLVDLNSKKARIVRLDRIIWLYPVDMGGTGFIKCHLDDMSELCIPLGQQQKVIQMICEFHPQAVAGYNRYMEMDMKENPQIFISRMKEGYYSTYRDER